MGIPRRKGVNEKQLQNLKQGNFPNIDTDKLAELINSSKKGEKVRLALLLGMLTKDNKIKGNSEMSDDEKSDFSKEKYKFFLNAPFEISAQCCNTMKKNPAHLYQKQTGRVPITATMASESRLRTQKWLQHSCNGFDLKIPTSSPLSFWTEQDILLYIKKFNLPICSVYGDIVPDYDEMGIIEGQMSITDYEGFENLELFDKDNVPLKTTGCSRTGCVLCGFGCHLESEEESRFRRLKETHPKFYGLLDLIKNNGVTYREAIDWVNEHGNLHIRY